jgi:sporulation protein YqfC
VGVKAKLTNAFSLPKEIVLDMPIITSTGRNEINIENYKNLLEFSETKIRVHTAAGLLVIEGARLRLKQITTENLIVLGSVSSLRW